MPNKNLLFIFDGRINADKAASLLVNNDIKRVDLFPLTGNLSLVQEIENYFRCAGFSDLFRYDTATIVDEQVGLVREKICKWSADASEIKIGQKNIKEWFILPGCDLSAWWLGLFAEKSPFKTDVFLRISQVHAVEQALRGKEYDFILLATSNKDLKKAIRNIVSKSSIPIIIVSSVNGDTLKERLKKSFKNFGLCAQVLRTNKYFFEFLKRKALIAARLTFNKNRFHDSGSMLFVSYFPLLDKKSMQNGIFRNRYASALQDKLRDVGLPITWIFIYVPVDGISFKDAVCAANKFAVNGEKLFFLEEFLSLWDVLRSLFLWIRQMFIGLFLFTAIKKRLISDPVGAENMPFIKSLWQESFCGPNALEGIFFTLAFRKMFKTVNGVKDCLYYLEMQPWEHALNSAKNWAQPCIRTIGFQHSSIPRNSFNYFYERIETLRTGKDTDLPLPDITACNGEIMQEFLAESGYPSITRLEALRYLHFDEILSLPVNSRKKRRTLLVAGSVSKNESIRLIMLMRYIFPRAEAFDICFKGHPSFPFEKLFSDLGIDAKESGYIVSHDDISSFLKESFAVVSLSSTVVIEALAFGCEVIVPIFPDMISIHPLVGFEKYYHKVCGAREMEAVIDKILNGYSLCNIQEYRKFVNKYWDIDKNIPRWSKLLNINNAKLENNEIYSKFCNGGK